MAPSSLLAHLSPERHKVALRLISIFLAGLIIAFTIFAVAKLRTPSSPTTSATTLTITSPSGVIIPSDQECTARVKRSGQEPRTDNIAANHRVPTQQQIAQLAPWNESIGVDPKADVLRKAITGNFTGTTDEILQWVACKWSIDPDIVRAQAIVESNWHQNQLGDYTSKRSACPPGIWDGKGCYQSYGILQIKYIYHQSEWPMSRDDTAFSAEFTYGDIRTCLEGWTTYLKPRIPLPGYPRYHAGDIWGCLGRWFSGTWYNQGAVNYIQKVKTALANKSWLQWGF